VPANARACAPRNGRCAAAALIDPPQPPVHRTHRGSVRCMTASARAIYSAAARSRSAEWRKECEALDASIRQLREQVGRATHGTAPMV
jgi:hypothetical protein